MYDNDITFTTAMKRATRKAHAVSDALVNAKLLFALYDNKVWAEGLLIFYEIFKFLEIAVVKKKDDNLGQIHVPELDRTAAFEQDLIYYLGEDWKKTYIIRESVVKYLKHLNFLLQANPDLLIPYYYHLYMGLLSGGQILRKKREIQSKLMKTDREGEAVTDFGDKSISELKTELKNKMNELSRNFDVEKKAELLEESVNVFEWNNSIVKTVQGTEAIAYKNIVIFVSCVFIVLSIAFYYLRFILKGIAQTILSN